METCYLMLWEQCSSLSYSFGHIALEIPNQCYISFWPKKGTKGCAIKNGWCEAEWYLSLKDEVDVNGHPKAVPVFGLDVNAIKSWWEKFTGENPQYDLREQNCAVIVYQALCIGNIWFEKNTGDCPGIKTPKRVFQFVADGYNKNQKVGCGCSCGHCVSLYPYLALDLVRRSVHKVVSVIFGASLASKIINLYPTPNTYSSSEPVETNTKDLGSIVESKSSNVQEIGSIQDTSGCIDVQLNKKGPVATETNKNDEDLEFIDLQKCKLTIPQSCRRRISQASDEIRDSV